MSKTLPFKPTKCWIHTSRDGCVLSSPDGTLAGVLTKNAPNALLVPLVPGHEWVLKPTAGKVRGKKKETKRG